MKEAFNSPAQILFYLDILMQIGAVILNLEDQLLDMWSLQLVGQLLGNRNYNPQLQYPQWKQNTWLHSVLYKS